MKQIIFILSFLLSASSVLAAPLTEFEGGKLYRSGKINILVLEGTYREMGRQYGGLIKDQIKEFYKVAIEERFIKKEGIPYEAIKNFSVPAFSIYPQRLQKISRGIAETSGLELEKVIILEAILGLTFLKTGEGAQCSALAAWGDYTGKGPLVMGRNYDSTIFFKEEFAPYLNVVIYKPEAAVPTAVLCYAGEVTSFSGMSKAGIFFENNEGIKSGGKEPAPDRLVFFASQVTFLMDYDNFYAFDAAMKTDRTNFALLANVATKDEAFSYELATFGTRRRGGKGLLAATNDFVDPGWKMKPPVDAPDRTVQRREHLLALGERYKGQITAKKMMQIMDTYFADGGATWPDRTAYQIVAVPAELTMYLKLRDYQDWTKVELGRYF